jgi:hypothetical protein
VCTPSDLTCCNTGRGLPVTFTAVMVESANVTNDAMPSNFTSDLLLFRLFCKKKKTVMNDLHASSRSSVLKLSQLSERQVTV